MKRSCIATLFLILIALFAPSIAMAQSEDAAQESVKQESVQADENDNHSPLHSGFSILFQAGPDVAIQNKIWTGSTHFPTTTAGLEASLDIGYKFTYFGIYLSTSYRANFAVKDEKKTYDTEYNTHIRYQYDAMKAGEWNGEVFGVGLMLMGFIPCNDNFIITLGTGLSGLFGTTMTRNETSYNLLSKVSLGFNIPISEQLMLGAALNYEFSILNDHRLQPAFSLTYTY